MPPHVKFERSQVGEETWNMLEASILYSRRGLHNAHTDEILKEPGGGRDMEYARGKHPLSKMGASQCPHM